MAHAEYALGSGTANGKSFWQQRIEAFALRKALLEACSLGLQFGVG